MILSDLKKAIIDNTLDISKPLIFQYTDNTFICQQYIETICKNKNLKKCEISALSDMQNEDDLFDSETNILYVYETDKLNETTPDDLSNLIIICKFAKSDIANDITIFAAALPWQIEDYVSMRVPGLEPAQVKWLCENCKHDIYRLDKECSKLDIFTPSYQKIVFDEINDDNGFCDINSLTIYSLATALFKKDFITVSAILQDLKWIDIEGTGLSTIAHNNLRNLINIQLNPRATAESLNMNPKQFNAIKYSCGKFSSNQLINAFDFITKLDCRLKSGEFSFKSDNRENNEVYVNYIVTNLIYYLTKKEKAKI